MMAAWAAEMAKRGLRTAIIVDREELIEQTLEWCPNASVLKAESKHEFNPDKLVQICMLQTAYRRQTELLNLDIDFAFFDEIHQYCDGKMFASICDCWRKAKIIGVSATPIDDRGYLLEGFDTIINDIQICDLIREGHLVEPQYYVPSDYNLDLSTVRMSSGDYAVDDLNDIMINKDCAQKIFDEWKRIAYNKKTIVFCSSIKHANFLSKFFANNGVTTAAVHSQDGARTDYINKFSSGKVTVLFNVGILVAGYNEPSVQCIVFANPTRVLRRYLQQAGRGLRTYRNKTKCLMLDMADVVRQHGFCNDRRFYTPAPPKFRECLIKECPECGAIVAKTAKVCPYCEYDFSALPVDIKGMPKKKMLALEKALSLQNELKDTISELVDARGYKKGYKWFLFIDCLKTKRPTESNIKFFRRKMTKIKKIKKNNWKLAALRYD